MPFDPTVTSQQCAALRAQVASSTRRISPSEIKGGLIVAAILAALLVSYAIMEIVHSLPTCDHSRCHVERLRAR